MSEAVKTTFRFFSTSTLLAMDLDAPRTLISLFRHLDETTVIKLASPSVAELKKESGAIL